MPRKIIRLILFVLFALIIFLIGNQVNGQPPSNISTPQTDSSLINNILVLLGGGGVGTLGSAMLNKHQQNQQQFNQPPDPSGFGVTVYTLDEKIKELERRHLRETEVIRTELKKIKTRINYINNHLDRTDETFKGKETLY